MSQIDPLPLDLTDRIPQEIFDEVAAFAKEGNLESLKNFSLVSHLWEVSTRPLRFSYLDFNPDLMYGIITGKHRACQRILPCVQRARFTFNPVGLEKEVSAIYLRMLKLRELVFLETSAQLVLLLSGIPEVSRHITTLVLNEVDGFPSFGALQRAIASFPGLQTLSMTDNRGSSTEYCEGGVEAEFVVPHNLKKATIKRMACYRCISRILSWLALRSDTIRYIEADGFLELSKFTRVETLIIGPSVILPVQTLSGCKALTTLKLRYPIWLRPGENQTWYSDLLSSVASPLSYLNFAMSFHVEQQLELMDWTTLNDLLQNSSYYAGLKAVEINLNLQEGHTLAISRDDCERMIRRRVVGLRPGTPFTVTVEVGSEMVSSFVYD